jgi:D-sedoheptulose 7-phosphate isomerase
LQNIIDTILKESLESKEDFINENTDKLIALSEKIASAFLDDKKLLICGNGGSAADAQHMAAEFVNRFELERPPLPALALTTDTSVITSIGNDYSFDEIFSKQVKALGVEGDLLLAISTSGNSKNILLAVEAARDLGIFTVGLLGKDGGKLQNAAHMALVVRHNVTARIQETHLLAEHIVCKLVDYILFQKHLEER